MTSFTPPPPSLTARCSARFYAASPAVMAGSSGGNGCCSGTEHDDWSTGEPGQLPHLVNNHIGDGGAGGGAAAVDRAAPEAAAVSYWPTSSCKLLSCSCEPSAHQQLV